MLIHNAAFPNITGMLRTKPVRKPPKASYDLSRVLNCPTYTCYVCHFYIIVEGDACLLTRPARKAPQSA